jgi:hypothetical protein
MSFPPTLVAVRGVIRRYRLYWVSLGALLRRANVVDHRIAGPATPPYGVGAGWSLLQPWPEPRCGSRASAWPRGAPVFCAPGGSYLLPR